MGLDVSHDAWHGAYSAFARWRHKIAELAGYAVWKVQYDDGYTDNTIMLDWGHITEANLMGEWDETPADPLIVILAHSDCDGLIHPAQAAPLADALEALMPKLVQLGDTTGHIQNWAYKTRLMIDGLRLAAERGEDLEFA